MFPHWGITLLESQLHDFFTRGHLGKAPELKSPDLGLHIPNSLPRESLKSFLRGMYELWEKIFHEHPCISVTSKSVCHKLCCHTIGFPLPVLAIVCIPCGVLWPFYKFLVETWGLQTGLCVLDCLQGLFSLRRKQPWMDSLCALTRHNSPWLPFVTFSVGIKCQTKKGYLDKGYLNILLYSLYLEFKVLGSQHL